MTRRLRIGFFTDSYLPATHGVEVSIETFRRNLERAGHQVFVYAPAVQSKPEDSRAFTTSSSPDVGDDAGWIGSVWGAAVVAGMILGLAVAGLAVLALAVAGTIYQSIGSARSARRFPPPGQLVDVGGHRLHAVCVGHGTPTVVLESAIAASSLSWTRVQPEVARFTSVCAYDRAGLAWSDASTAPRTISRIVDELHALLTKLECAAPYVMVGHSFGVFVCLAYTKLYPHQVDGLVLVDPPSEWMHMDQRQARLLWGAGHLSRLGGLLARLGVVRACLALLTGGVPAAPRHFVKVFGPTTARTLERLVGEVRKLPPDVHPVVQALWCQPKCFRAMADHLRALPDVAFSAAQLEPLGDLPLVVISSGDQTPEVAASHQELARTSSRGRHVIASNSHHWVQFDEPELVVEAIREVVDASRRPHVSATRSG